MNIMELINNFKDPVLIEQLSQGEKKLRIPICNTTRYDDHIHCANRSLGSNCYVFKKNGSKKCRSKKKKAGAVVDVKPAAPVAPVVTAVEPEEDEEELVAVISAAIAAQMGTSMHNIVVRNIVRVSDATPAWGQSGRMEQMNSRM